MKRLQCEMCGSVDLIKQDGVFVCQTCGTKYSVEEAKKMMIEGTVDVSGSTVKVDNSDTVANYLSLLETALKSNNNEQTELYCNKIIEIDPTNWYAWLKKGHAAGWQSALNNNRIDEAIMCFAKAKEYAEDKDAINKEAKEDVQNLCLALMKVQLERFCKWPDKDESTGVIQVLQVILQSMSTFIRTMQYDIDIPELLTPVANAITLDVLETWKKAVQEYQADDDSGHPGKYAYEKLLEKANCCSHLLQKTIDLVDCDDDMDIKRYEILVQINNYTMSNYGWDFHYQTEYALGVSYPSKKWYIVSQMTDSAIASKNHEIDTYVGKIAKIKEKVKRESRDKYWQEHADRKAELDKEAEELRKAIKAAENQLGKIDEDPSISQWKKQIQEYEMEKASLGAFSIKRKTEINKESKELEKKINERRNQLTTSIKEKKAKDERRYEAIKDELNGKQQTANRNTRTFVKCKICGIKTEVINGESIVECRACGTRQILPL